MLKKRLYFLLPELGEARIMVEELKVLLGATRSRLHLMVQGEGGAMELVEPGLRGSEGGDSGLERLFWYSSVVIFVFALIAMVLALVSGSLLLTGVFLLIAVAMQMSGLLFANRPGNADLDRFRDALAEGEVLLVIDMERQHVSKVRQLINSHHPRAQSGGSGWYIDALYH